MDTKAKRALYDNLGKNEEVANELNNRIMATKKDGWRNHFQKSKAVRHAISEGLFNYGIKDDEEIHRIFDIVKNQKDY